MTVTSERASDRDRRTSGKLITSARGSTHAGTMGVGAYTPRTLIDDDEAVPFIDSSEQWI